MRKRCSGCGIGIVISRNVDGLNRSDRTFCGGCNSFLKLAHFRCQRWLIPHCRRHSAQQSRDFGTGLRKSKDVVDEEKNVLSLIVAKIFGSGESRKGNAQPCSRRFGHLAINERGLIDDGHALTRLRLFHFQPEIVPLAGALADTSEYGNAAVFGRNIVDKFLNDDGLSYSRTSEQTNFSALQIWLDQIDNLDSSLEHFKICILVNKRRSRLVNGITPLCFDRSQLVDGFSNHVNDAPQGGFADRNGYRSPGVFSRHTAHHPFRWL